MQFKTLTVLFAALAASSGVSAAPTSAKRLSLTCPILDCVKSLAPTVGACATAAIALGANIAGDITCLTDAAQLAISFPASCSACADELGLGGIFDEAKDAVEDAADDVFGAIGGIFGREDEDEE